MPLTGEEIRKRIDNEGMIEGMRADHIRTASYDVTAGNIAQTFRRVPGGVDLRRTDSVRLSEREVVVEKNGYQMVPGEYMLIRSQEQFHLPKDMTAYLRPREVFNRLGLLLHGQQLDPGFSGYVYLGLTNATPNIIVLTPGLCVGEMVFEETYTHREAPVLTSNAADEPKPAVETVTSKSSASAVSNAVLTSNASASAQASVSTSASVQAAVNAFEAKAAAAKDVAASATPAFSLTGENEPSAKVGSVTDVDVKSDTAAFVKTEPVAETGKAAKETADVKSDTTNSVKDEPVPGAGKETVDVKPESAKPAAKPDVPSAQDIEDKTLPGIPVVKKAAPVTEETVVIPSVRETLFSPNKKAKPESNADDEKKSSARGLQAEPVFPMSSPEKWPVRPTPKMSTPHSGGHMPSAPVPPSGLKKKSGAKPAEDSYDEEQQNKPQSPKDKVSGFFRRFIQDEKG